MKFVTTLTLAAAAVSALEVPQQKLFDGFPFLPSLSWLGLKASGQQPGGQSALSNGSVFGMPRASDFHWSVPPLCKPSGSSSEPICVFSLHSFAEGRGISVITTYSSIASMLERPALGQNQTPKEANVRSGPPPFEEREVAGAGRFLVANKTMRRGDQIFVHTPVALISQEASEIEDLGVRYALFQHAADSLPPASQELFWSLAAHQGPKVNPFEDRMETNAFGFEIEGEDYFVVNVEIARMNHDCRPNAAYFFDERSLTQYVHATRDIHPGDEITISYTDMQQPRAVRQAALLQNWGFQCSCSLCTQHPSVSKESDARIARILHLTETLNDLRGDDDSEYPTSTDEEDDHAAREKGSLSAALELMGLMTLERLPATGDAATRLALEYAALGDANQARLWARHAVESTLLEEGFSHPSLQWARGLAEKPEDHWSWRKRAEKAGEGGCGCGCNHKH